MAELSVQRLDWDTAQLGLSCGLIDATEVDPVQGQRLCAKLLEAKDVEFMTVKLGSGSTEAVNELVGMGARLVDTELTFLYSGQQGVVEENPVTEISVRLLPEVDPSPFVGLAADMKLSRFFRDAAVPHEKALALWENSISNHCQGYGDGLAVAYLEGKPCGLVALRRKGRKGLFLHIVGVLKAYRGRGVALGMLGAVANEYSNENSIFVETQSINQPAIALYSKAGFSLDSVRYILHYWRQ